MRYKVDVSMNAKDDIRSIYAYIAFALLSPMNAEKMLKKIQKAISSLETFPEGFPNYTNLEKPNQNIRFRRVENYKIIFDIDHTGQKVTILRVLNSKQGSDIRLFR
jgi:toxin ParE1/3/4